MLKDYLSKLLVFAVLFWATGTALSQSPLTISAPAGIAGDYIAVQAAFGPWANAQAADVVLIDDGTGATTGCVAASNDLTGKIALIDRGACAFTVKALNAEAAGAIAVVVCNTSTLPDTAIVMGGSDGCALTIPAVMISYNNCQIIKAELGNGVTATMPANKPADGEAVGAEIALPGAGTYIATPLTGTGALFSDAVAAQVYTIVAPMDAVMNVNSCNGGADTRLVVLQGCRNALSIVGDNDDACDLGTGDLYASSLDVVVYAGQTYLIYWDDHWDANGFDFNVSFGALPSIDVTFKVDMQDVTVDPAGAYIIGSFTGITPIAMTDNGDGTWSYTATVTAGDELQWRYMNGPATFEDSPDLAACGVDDGAGGFNRYYLVGLENAELGLVCYNSCNSCPPDEACPSWIKEDFEGYALGTIGNQSPDDVWSTWSFAPGGPEDGLVSDEQANSGGQSLKISKAGEDDVLMLLGDRTSGNFVLKWKMFIPAGSSGYYNIQKFQNAPGNPGYALQVDLYADGTGDIDAGAENVVTFNYPQDEWFEVFHYIDLDNDWSRMWVAGKTVYEWPAHWQIFSTTGTKQLGSVDFFGNTGNLYYVDDVLLKEIEPCPANAIICDGLDGYNLGEMNNQSPWWDTWTPGSATEDGLVTNEQFSSCEQSLKISNADGDDQLLVLGLRTDGNYWLSWDMFVPVGSSGYYNIQKNAIAATSNADFAMAANFAADGTGTIDVGAVGAGTFTYPQDEWFNVAHRYDLDNNLAILYINGVEVMNWAASLTASQGQGAKKIGAVDFYGNTGNLYFVDNALFLQLPTVPGDICGGSIDLNSYLGQGMGTTTSTGLYDNTAYTSTALDPTTGFECFGEPDGGGAAPSLEHTIWYTFTGDGETYFIETGQCSSTNYITDGDTQMAIYSGTCGNLTPVDCNEDSPNATTGNYISGLELATEAGTVYYMMIDGFNFNGAISEGEFCINFTQLTGPVPTVSVTFAVDLTYYLAAGNTLETVKIAGNFGANGAALPDWDPTAAPAFTDLGNDVWSTTIEFPAASAGQNLEFKFLNTATSWGNCGVQQECMGAEDANCKNPNNDNRLLVIPAVDTDLCYTWETCLGCNVVATHEFIEIPMTIAPNPFSEQTVVSFNSAILDGQVRLTNLAGQVMRVYAVNGPQLIIAKGDLAPGMYFLNVVTEDGTSAAQKLVVE